ncbi:MAG: hypothetical protein ACFFFT_18080 [Candidatus Thorarchaeota archaeon]
MKKGVYFLGTFLLVLLIFFANTNLVLASDDDGDHIDDEFEELNYRDVEISFDSNETEIESILRNGDQIDAIEIGVRYDEEGIEIEVSYESDYTSEGEEDFEIEFGVSFRTIIEYVDLNDNNVYDPLIDDKIQEYQLKTFQNVNYIEEQITQQTSLHHLIINSSDGIFILHVYFPEEFNLLNNTLITPSKPKIDIEIMNFNFLNSSSKLALDIRLESNQSYEEYETTEDEERGYAFNEQAVSTIHNDFTGIFSWNENATIDGISSRVIASNLNNNATEDQKLYLNYEQGIHIYHDPKIGLEGILRSASITTFPWNIVFILLIISAVSISVAIPVYYYFHNHEKTIPLKKVDKTKKTKKIQRKLTITDLSELQNFEVTALSEEFYDLISQFEWDTNEKEEFLNEMLSLTPEEREKILSEMVKRSNLD